MMLPARPDSAPGRPRPVLAPSRRFALIAYVTDSERSFQTTPLARASGPPERGRGRIRRKHGALFLTLNWSLNGSLNGYPLWPTTEVAFAAVTSAF